MPSGLANPMLLGCDFTSSPSKRKPIVCAWGAERLGVVRVLQMERIPSFEAFTQALERHLQWIGGFDMPFGLPRELVQTLGWPTQWALCIKHYAALDRASIREAFKAFCDARPVGSKFAHRATDIPAGSSPSMKWVNPPVAFMLHAGVPLLQSVSAFFPGIEALQNQDNRMRIALEAYPGLLARELIDKRSYKSDDRSRQTHDRLIARKDIVNRLELGKTRLGLRLQLSAAQHDMLVEDASGDCLDAVLCLMQAAWAAGQQAQGSLSYGLPTTIDALEGWIITA